jgi:hypothetical protein
MGFQEIGQRFREEKNGEKVWSINFRNGMKIDMIMPDNGKRGQGER